MSNPSDLPMFLEEEEVENVHKVGAESGRKKN